MKYRLIIVMLYGSYMFKNCYWATKLIKNRRTMEVIWVAKVIQLLIKRLSAFISFVLIQNCFYDTITNFSRCIYIEDHLNIYSYRHFDLIIAKYIENRKVREMLSLLSTIAQFLLVLGIIQIYVCVCID